MRITIIGAGISGLSLAFAIWQKRKDIDLKIFEKCEQVGGKIKTERINGYLCEASVNGFLSNKKETLDLTNTLSLPLLRSNDNARKRFILLGEQLKLIPDNPKAFLFSNFLSIRGRLRVLAEYFIPKGSFDDESLEAFAIRRVGKEFFEKLLDPMASGIYAGDPSEMSIKSCFRRVYDIEKKYGSLIKGFIALAKEGKKSGKQVSAGPSGILHTFSEGMYSIISCLREALKESIQTEKIVQGIHKKKNCYEIHFTDGTSYDSEIVVFATPAYVTARCLSNLDNEIGKILNTIPYPPVSVVAIGISTNKIKRDTNSFGFLIPAKENKKILGTLFDSSIFSGRAPKDKTLMRVFVGGQRNPQIAMLDDEALIKTVFTELKNILFMEGEPDLVKIYRWEKAIPQYLLGHDEKLRLIDQILLKFKGIYLTGNAYRGVSFNDCVANSFKLADEIIYSIQNQ
ncbi:MAG: protoporphyrinogen oxidase [Thermodesulfovibrionales bacterium]|nr:protoporphyrinogen oxidase [Thermodesulfovibrionales bacterium]